MDGPSAERGGVGGGGRRLDWRPCALSSVRPGQSSAGPVLLQPCGVSSLPGSDGGATDRHGPVLRPGGLHRAFDHADPEDVKATLRPFHTRVQRQIERFGGTLDKFVGDAGLGVFGAPIAHEDDPDGSGRAWRSTRRWQT